MVYYVYSLRILVFVSSRNSHGLSIIEGIPTVFGGYDFLPETSIENKTFKQVPGTPIDNDNSELSDNSIENKNFKRASDIVETFEGGVWRDLGLRLTEVKLDFAVVEVPAGSVQCIE